MDLVWGDVTLLKGRGQKKKHIGFRREPQKGRLIAAEKHEREG